MTTQEDAMAPDLADIPYGTHPRNVFDLWRATRAGPAPLLIWIHGGGFMGGDKSNVQKIDIAATRAAGYAVASIHYRLTDAAPFPAQMHDAARALQHLRLHAAEYGIDPQRVVCAGGSAGSGISQWLGYHQDLADPEAQDPLERQSTRIQAVGAFNMQCTYDPRLIKEIVPGDAYKHVAMKRLFGVSDDFDWDRDPIPVEVKARIRECGPLSLLTDTAPPVFICHHERNRVVGDIHHANFGSHLAQHLKRLGIPHEQHMDAEVEATGRTLFDAFREFLGRHLG